MRKLFLLFAVIGLAAVASADVLTFTFLNFSTATFSASAGGLSFGNAVNVLVTDNTNGSNFTLAAVDSGVTGTATSFSAGPPLIATFNGNGLGSVLVKSGSHTFLSGSMDGHGELEAQYPAKAGAFGSRFAVNFIDPAVLADLGLTGSHIDPEGSVSLTLDETAFNGTTLSGVLGGGSITIETVAASVPEDSTWMLMASGVVLTGLYLRKQITTMRKQL